MAATDSELRKVKRVKVCEHRVPLGKHCARCLEAVARFWQLYDDEERRMGRRLPKCKAPPL